MSNFYEQYKILELPTQIEATHANKSIEKLQSYYGCSAHLKLFHYDRRVLETINLHGVVKFRDPSTYHHWGFVVKGNEQYISILVKVEDVCRFELYDQVIRENIKEGTVVHLEFEWTTSTFKSPSSKKIVFNANEFSLFD